MTKNACVPNTAEILKMSYISMYVIFDFSFFWTFSTFSDYFEDHFFGFCETSYKCTEREKSRFFQESDDTIR